MICGYRIEGFIEIWTPPKSLVHANNLLMLLAVSLLAMFMKKGRMRACMLHPMLNAVKLWASAHLLVNGDLASILLFGGMLA